MKKAKKKIILAFFLGTGLFLFIPSPLQAWKTITRVHLVLVCREDALDDGKLVIYEMDYETGRIRRDSQGKLAEIGRDEVDPAILQAIRQFPSHLRAGAVGTDVLPDLITAQAIVHPDNSSIGKTVSDDWLRLIWQEAAKNRTAQAMAFATGYLAHAAGDLFGHTFINYYAGGPFELGPNAIKHIVLEAYIDKRTPRKEKDFFHLSIKGIEHFLYANLVIHPMIWRRPDNLSAAWLMNFSPQRFFAFLKEFLSEKQIEAANNLA